MVVHGDGDVVSCLVELEVQRDCWRDGPRTVQHVSVEVDAHHVAFAHLVPGHPGGPPEGQLGHRDRVPPGLDQGGELGVEDLRGNPQTRERIGGLRRLGDPVVREDRNVENQSASRPAAASGRPVVNGV